MVCSKVSFNLENKTISGYVTDIIPHDAGGESYEVLAEGSCYYLKKGEFRVMSKIASQKQVIPEYKSASSIKSEIEKLANISSGNVQKELQGIIKKHF